MVNFSYLTLNNGQKMPNFGLGTWLSKPGQVKQAVEIAIANGYRHIDCAHCYENQHEVGEAINNKIADGTVKREDLWITTKIWNIYHHPDQVQRGFEKCVDSLNLDYVDLVLIHWPTAFQLKTNEQGEDVMHPEKDSGDFGPLVENSEEFHYLAMWNKMVELQKSTWGSKIRSLGVSNFNVSQLQNLIDNSELVPAVNQIEGHPFLTQPKLSQFCADNKIVITNYSPLGNPSIGQGF